MRHLLVSSEVGPGERIRLGSGDCHYLVDVLRLGPGSEFDLLDGGGRMFRATIAEAGDDYLVAVVGEMHTQTEPVIPVVLYQAVPKGQKLDDIIRQAVQAGATTIVPLITERTIVRETAPPETRMDRWRRVAREAVQQSGALAPIEITAPMPITEISAGTESVALFLHTQTIAQSTLHGYLDRVPERVELVVGPEGGFAEAEVSLLADRGFRPLYLGPRVLRTETAAVFALGAVQILLQERGSWRPID